MECSIPWLTKQYGYKTKITGIFNRVESCSSLSFKEFLSAERLILDMDINYPLVWNDLQTWNVNLELYKGSLFFIFCHKLFFQDLINDWSSREMGDIRKYVPYIYSINLKATDIEVILPCNQHNWLDTNVLENNAYFEVLAKNASLKIDLYFDQFLTPTTNIVLDIKVFDACARFIIPPSNSNLALLKILRKKIKYISIKNGEQKMFNLKRWSKFDKSSNDQQPILSHIAESTESIPDESKRLLSEAKPELVSENSILK